MKNRFSLLCSAALLLASSVCAQTEVRMDMYVPLFNSGEWYDSQNSESGRKLLYFPRSPA